MSPKYVTLAEWAQQRYSKLPHVNTLRRWAKDGTIIPQPVKMAGEFYVLATARHVNEAEPQDLDDLPEVVPATPSVETPSEWLQREWRTLVVTPEQVQAGKRPIYSMRGSGVYLVLDRQGSVAYVGESTNMNARCRRHESSWPTASAYAIECPDHWRKTLEGTYIQALSPRLNVERPAHITEVPILRELERAWAGEVAFAIPFQPC